ncbi:ATP-binding cassette domain-containing protein [Gordonia hongkongensis]|uniref:ATP-binding cassette domain-containing protein n=1 Tax=Gordonia hongkongensis TaxID=1701090 RepID=A0AAX3T531_9ACTN|nr:ATP-binding cassette domain-containing protein [Gordonia hongkongensis]MDF6101200.1 ATP-binding cassette domain-containing protein [Gordonia hongkongensis]WFP24008.1 ATP-binding cassette domain-containing protein [Gordonia hongkongensis]
MSEATERVAAYEPRHRRSQGGPDDLADPFGLPDPVEEKLRRWRAERDGPVAAETNGQSPPAEESVAERSSKGAGSSASAITRSPAGAVGQWQTPMTERVADPGPAAFEPTAPFGSPTPSTSPEPFTSPTEFGEAQPVQTPRVAPLPEPAQPGDRQAPVLAPSSSPPAIVVSNLRKTFKETVAVEDVSFAVPAGSIVAILGPNGAGKTTTVNMLCTLLKPDGGSASVCGHDVQHEAAAVRRSIMLTGQFAALDESLTGRENLILFGRLLGLSKKAARTRADELLDTFSLVDAGAKKVGKYSGGMRRRIDIACGLVTSPKVVFLDEPTTGLDPRSRQEVWSLVETLKRSGVTILLTTQYLEEADTLSDNIVVIDKGRVVAEGTSDELKGSIGAAYCEVTPAHASDLPALRLVLSDLEPKPADSSVDTHVVAVPAPGGPQTLVEVIRRTSEAGIALSDVAMRRPSLDEVFLALTDPRRDRKPTS